MTVNVIISRPFYSGFDAWMTLTPQWSGAPFGGLRETNHWRQRHRPAGLEAPGLPLPHQSPPQHTRTWQPGSLEVQVIENISHWKADSTFLHNQYNNHNNASVTEIGLALRLSSDRCENSLGLATNRQRSSLQSTNCCGYDWGKQDDHNLRSSVDFEHNSKKCIHYIYGIKPAP